MTAAVALSAEIDGDRIPLEDCTWVLLSPSGCAFALLDPDQAATPEASLAYHLPVREIRERRLRQGWRVELMPRRTCKGVYECLRGRCEHPADSRQRCCAQCGRTGRQGFEAIGPSGRGKHMITVCSSKSACRKRRPKPVDEEGK